MYKVFDSCGKLVKSGFPSWQSAFQFKIVRQRYDWKISNKPLNPKQL